MSVTAMLPTTPAAVAMLPTRKTSLRLQMLRSAWSRFMAFSLSLVSHGVQSIPIATQLGGEKGPAMTRVALLLVGAVVVIFGGPGTGAEKRAIAPAGVKPIGPYSPGVLCEYSAERRDSRSTGLSSTAERFLPGDLHCTVTAHDVQSRACEPRLRFRQAPAMNPLPPPLAFFGLLLSGLGQSATAGGH